jgi:hypothetical protein
MSNDHHDILRIHPTATTAEIRRAFRRVAAEWHPAKWAEREPALGDAMFRATAEAYLALGEPLPASADDSGPAVSSERALEVFAAEMAVFAGELFAEGMDSRAVEDYLISSGCPDGAAREAVRASVSSLGPSAAQTAKASRRTPPWPILEPLFVAFLSGHADPDRMEDSRFAEIAATHRRREVILLAVLSGIAVLAIGAGLVKAPGWLAPVIPLALLLTVLVWLAVAVRDAWRHPGFRLERKLRLDLASMREIAHRARPGLSEFSLEAALGGPVWAAHQRMGRLALVWLLLALGANIVVLALGQNPLPLVPAWLVASIGLGLAAGRLRFRRALRLFADCEAQAPSEVRACVARLGGSRPSHAIAMVLVILLMIAVNVAMLRDGRQVPLTPSSVTSQAAPRAAAVERSPAEIARDAEAEESARVRQERRESAQRFNELMSEFEKRHPEFDNRSPSHNPSDRDPGGQGTEQSRRAATGDGRIRTTARRPSGSWFDAAAPGADATAFAAGGAAGDRRGWTQDSLRDIPSRMSAMTDALFPARS